MKCVAVLHDCACLHAATCTVESLHQQNLEVLKHPLCRPGMAPTDCHPFGSLRNALRDQHFVSDKEVKEAVNVFSEGMQKHVDHWTKCVL